MPPPRQRVMSDPSLSMAAAATRSLPSSPVKNNPKHYPPSVTQSAYHHRRHLSHDLEDDDEASCSDLYVNQRDIHEAVRLRHRRRHRYEVMDGEDEDDEDAFEDGLDLGSRDELTPNFSSSQYSLNRTPLIQPNGGAFHQSQNSLNRSQDYSNDCFARPMKPISPLKKRPVPTPRTILNTSASVVTTGDEAETATTDGESVNRNPSMVSSSFANSLSPIE